MPVIFRSREQRGKHRALAVDVHWIRARIDVRPATQRAAQREIVARGFSIGGQIQEAERAVEGIHGIEIIVPGIHRRAIRQRAILRATGRPQLGDDFPARQMPRPPGQQLATVGTNEISHPVHERRVFQMHFIRPHVKIFRGHLIQKFAHAIRQNLHAALALHVHAKGALEIIAVARHVNFRDHRDAAPGAAGYKPVQFRVGVKLTRRPGGKIIFGIIQFRVHAAFDAPAGVVGQMKMKNIHFVVGHHFGEVLQQWEILKVPAHIMHESAPGKCRPVGDVASGDSGGAGQQLSQGFHAVQPANRLASGKADAVGGNVERVGFRRGGVDGALTESDGQSAGHLAPGRQGLPAFTSGKSGLRRGDDLIARAVHRASLPCDRLRGGNQGRPLGRRRSGQPGSQQHAKDATEAHGLIQSKNPSASNLARSSDTCSAVRLALGSLAGPTSTPSIFMTALAAPM